nr:FlgD immunoglobulin-like domain containing protein [Candidatus Krumholzibacteria bacterium]
MMDQPAHPAPHPRPDLMKGARGTDWQAMIDAVWGPGRSASEQTGIFQDFIETLDHEYALFRNRNVNLNALAAQYLAEIQGGVSKGRFQAVMNKMCLAVQNGHTSLINQDVYFTFPEPGVPLLIGHHYMNHPYFGACLTTDDHGIFVYDVVDNHPLNLEVGDRILGYDGRPWGELYQELLYEELPVGQGGWLTSDASFAYGWDTVAGSNWHLFTTIDIQKYSSGEVVHLPTSLMVEAAVGLSLQCTDQINQEIPRPTAPDWVTWGVVPRGEKRIGFIRADGWTDDAETAWEQACLAMVDDPDLDGLIIDFRTNFGGNMFLSNAGLAHLFNTTVSTIDWGFRTIPSNHWAMGRQGAASYYDIPGNPADYFDKPIAVLLGPKTISSGDQVALRMIYHPMVRTFGRQTSTSFDSPVSYDLAEYPELYARFSKYDAGPADDFNSYYSYLGFPVDEEVWLNPADARTGKDAVIEAAMEWIITDVSAVPLDPGATSRISGIAPNPSNPITRIHFELKETGPCRLDIYDLAGRLIAHRSWVNLEMGDHTFEWDGTLTSGAGAASGLYMVRLTAADGEAHSRFTLVR